MPSRPMTALIVIAWLGTLGWLGYREVWPRLHPGDAPPFVIELEDELTSQMANFDPTRTADVVWVIRKNDQPIGKAYTSLRYIQADNSFELQTRIAELKLKQDFIEIPAMTTTYHLNRRGELLGLEVQGAMLLLTSYRAEASFHGKVRDGKLYRSGEIRLPGIADPIAPELEAVDAPTGTFLNPLHPVPRIKGLKPGRQWRMQVVNPLADAVAPSLQAIQQKLLPGGKAWQINLPGGPKFLNAEVLRDTTTVDYNSAPWRCYTIEYRGEHETLRTFVRVTDGWVLRQESEALGERFVMERQ